MEITYSKYKTYLNCPRLYYKEATREEYPMEISSYFSLYGKLIESFFKIYTNDFSKNNIRLSNDLIRRTLQNNWERILENDYICWTDPWATQSQDEIFEEVYDDVLKNLEAFNFWKDARAEVTINIQLKNKDILTGRLDFLYNSPRNTVEIIDGKGTKKPDKNVDVEQLYFYALLYYLRYKKLPDKMGFLFYRFHSIKYIDFTIEDIKDFKNKLVLVKNCILNDKDFIPKVKISKHCKWCNYHLICDAYLNKKGSKKKKHNHLEKVLQEGEISEFDF